MTNERLSHQLLILLTSAMVAVFLVMLLVTMPKLEALTASLFGLR